MSFKVKSSSKLKAKPDVHQDYPVRRSVAPKPPEMYHERITGYTYPITAPEPNLDFVFVGNRDNFQYKWVRKGTPIDKEDIGSSYSSFNPKSLYGDIHHNLNIPRESKMSDDEFRQALVPYELPTSTLHDMWRKDLFKMYINSKNPLISSETQSGERPPTDNELAYVQYVHERMGEPKDGELYRNLRKEQNLSSQSSPSAESGRPMPDLDWWRQQIISPQQRQMASQQQQRGPNTIGTGNNPMTLSNMNEEIPNHMTLSNASGAIGAARSIGAMAPEGSMMGAIGGAAGSIYPAVGLGLMAKSLYDMHQQDKKERYSKIMQM